MNQVFNGENFKGERTPKFVELRDATVEDSFAAKEVYILAWTYLARSVLGFEGAPVMKPEDQKIRPTQIMTVNGQVVAFYESQRQWLHRLYVHPAQHGLGLGRALLRSAMGRGVKWLWVDEGNVPARRLYESEGWVWSGVTDPGLNWPNFKVLRYERVSQASK